jgi:hypothetical protein
MRRAVFRFLPWKQVPRRPSCFADIAGFTALTEAHGDKPAVQLVDDFAAIVQAELPNVGGEYVKTVGDALMLRVPDPGNAIRLGLWLTRNAMRGHQAPSVRLGGNFGSAVERGGDYFGTTINVAARVSALARGGSSSSQAIQRRSQLTSTACSTSRAGGKPCETSLSPWRSSPSFAWTRTLSTSSWIPSARWRSIETSSRSLDARRERVLLLFAQLRGYLLTEPTAILLTQRQQNALAIEQEARPLVGAS